MSPLDNKESTCVFHGTEGFGLGVPFNRMEDPVLPTFFDIVCFSRAGLLAARRRWCAALRVMVAPAMDRDTFDAGTNGTILEGSDQLSR
jgi:hypothetical protein